MANVQDLIERKVADRVGRDGDIWWAVVCVDTNGPKPRMFLHAEGDTPLDATFNYLYDDQVQYVLFKVLGVDNRGAVTSTRCKLVLAQWIGPTVPRLKKTNAMATKKSMSEYFLGHHLSIELNDRSGLTEKDIEARLRAAGGAHQPSDMQFSAGTNAVIITAVDSLPPPKVEAAAPAPAPAPVASPVSPAPVATPKPAPSSGSSSRAKVEAQAAAEALGKAAGRLGELVEAHKGGAIPAGEVAAFIDSLGGASTKLLAVVGLLA